MPSFGRRCGHGLRYVALGGGLTPGKSRKSRTALGQGTVCALPVGARNGSDLRVTGRGC